METESTLVVTRGWEEGVWGIVKWGQKFGFARLKSTRDWFHNNVNMLNT